MVPPGNLMTMYVTTKALSERAHAHTQCAFLAYLLDMAVIELEFQFELATRRSECVASERVKPKLAA